VSRISELVGVHGWPWWRDCSRKSEGSDIDTGSLLVIQYVSDLVRVFKHSSLFSYENTTDKHGSILYDDRRTGDVVVVRVRMQ
jgi:hypothetical protein